MSNMANALLNDWTTRDGIYFPRDGAPVSAYRQQWEQEAAFDHVRSAIATTGDGREDFATLAGKIGEVWQRFPSDQHIGTVLEIGCGYGRIPLYLSREKKLTCDRYFGVDIAETMLRHFLRYRAAFAIFPSAQYSLICGSADALPLPNDSVDLCLSSAVFLHMGKQFVQRTLHEIARVLKPGGAFIFDASFPNRYCPAFWPTRALNALSGRRPPNVLKYYTRAEIARRLETSGLTRKASGYRISAASWMLLPKNVWRLSVPGARQINAALTPPPKFLTPLAAASYTVTSISQPNQPMRPLAGK